VGRLTYRLERSHQIETFYRLLDTYYHKLPKLDRKQPPRVTVIYVDRRSGRQIPIGATADLEVGDEQVLLPYHPCLADYFFGHRYYKLRRRLLSSGALTGGGARASP
jgi:hypothetical protein